MDAISYNEPPLAPTVRWIPVLKSIVHHQMQTARNVLLGLPAQPPSIGSMTLDADDLNLVKDLLARPQSWADEEIVFRYQEAFAAWNGSRHAFSFMGGRVALSAAIYALDLQPGDEVVIPGYTCVVVPNAFEYAGVKPIYADIELETYGLSAESLRGRITPKTKAVLLHHLFGLVCRDYDAILEIARLHDLKVIEDCAHATGATYKGIRVGNTGDIAFYSSETSKVFNTIQGGMVVTGSDVIAEKLRQYHRQAPEPSSGRIDSLLHNVLLNYYQFKHRHRWVLGDLYRLRYYRKTLVATTEEELRGVKPAHYGCRMPAPLAALGLNQLRKIDRYIEARRKQAVNWDRWCDANGYARPLVLPGSNPVWLRYPVLVEPEKKSDTSWAMRELGVQPGVWFVSHLHPQQRYIEGCPNADIAVAQCINFPTLV